MSERQTKHRLFPPYAYLLSGLSLCAIAIIIAISLMIIDFPDLGLIRAWYAYPFAVILFFIGAYLCFVYGFTVSIFIVIDPGRIRIKNIFVKDEYVFDKRDIENIVTSESSKLTEERYRTGRKYYPYGYWHKNQIYIHSRDRTSFHWNGSEPDHGYDSFLFKLKDHESFIEECKRYDYPMVVISREEK